MKALATDGVHSLEIPLAGVSLLVPSAAVAEVVPITDLASAGGGAAWILGMLAWRSLAVPVIAFEALLGMGRTAPTMASKIAVFYPFPGRSTREFFAVLSADEPRVQTVDASFIVATDSELPDSKFVAAGIKLENRILCIPHMDVLCKTLYP